MVRKDNADQARRRELFFIAEEPTYPHCAHLFDDSAALRKGAYGKWCHEPPTYNGLCRHHTTEALRARALRNAQRSEPENPWVDTDDDITAGHSG